MISDMAYPQPHHTASSIGSLAAWRAPAAISGAAIHGEAATLLPLDAARHGAALHGLLAGDDEHWRNLPYGPFADEAAFLAWLEAAVQLADTALYAVFAKDGARPLGFLGYRQMEPAHGAIEIGHVNFSRELRRTRVATEAVHLLLKTAFELGYRRCEWRCDSLNAASASAARRLGFQFEGELRQAMVVKGRNRDTLLFSMLDGEWQRLKPAHQAYLAAANFGADGRQRRPLRDFLEAADAFV